MRGPNTLLGVLGMAAVTALLIKIVVAIWPVLVGAVALLVAWLVFDLWRDRIAAQRAAEAARIAALIEHADREHRLVQQGDLRGIYGAYAVPDECQGIGIWLCDNGTNANGPPKRAVA